MDDYTWTARDLATLAERDPEAIRAARDLAPALTFAGVTLRRGSRVFMRNIAGILGFDAHGVVDEVGLRGEDPAHVGITFERNPDTDARRVELAVFLAKDRPSFLPQRSQGPLPYPLGEEEGPLVLDAAGVRNAIQRGWLTVEAAPLDVVDVA
ncbi:MAG TPA: hypothetical protein PLN93_11265 [Vicinamibacterales bacterium]|nr:hypothetical protein [Vicinamibacterales bacterium]